jgi:PST family polysaccharide transporter
VEKVALPWGLFSREAAQMLKLGLVFLSIMLMSLGVAYLARIIVVQHLGFRAAGYYQAAWAVGALYVMTILQMMGADFLPRLSTVANSDAECIRLVNEQVEVNMLMGGPGILATLSLSPLVIILFYSTRFGPATEVLRWICLGMSLRIASWPMGYILIAKNSRSLVFWSELLNRSVELGMTWVCVRLFGLVGAGIGFFVSCVFYWFLIYSIVQSKFGFRWSTKNRRIGLIYGWLILAGFIAWYLFPHAAVITGGILVSLVSAYCSLKAICALLPFERLPRLLQEIITLFRLSAVSLTRP